MKKSIDIAYNRIKNFHSKQKFLPFKIKDKFNNELLYKYSPIDRVGVYVQVEQQVIQVQFLWIVFLQVLQALKIFLTTPALENSVNPAIIYAAKKCGVKEIYKTGGAHSIAALSFGTKTFKKVDKIVGPGNAYVALAKRRSSEK